jgi:carboxynorspermidine decarboxylase
VTAASSDAHGGAPAAIAIPGRALADVPTPCFVVDIALIERNCRTLDRVQREGGARVLLALKGFATWALFPAIARSLAGCAASGLHEAMLAREKFGGEVHVYSPAFSDGDLERVLPIADHIVFNSLAQWQRFAHHWKGPAGRTPSRGLRLNPEHREVAVALYDPCAPGSRLGVTRAALGGTLPDGIEGLHFHTLCELDSDALERTLGAVEERFGEALRDPRIRWMNFGGGHHITRPGYDIDRLVRLVRAHRERFGHQVYLEPGEAVALNTGVLIASVLDVVPGDGIDVAILDASATAHMPDVLEMPYRPFIEGGGEPGERRHTYRLGGPTCLAGDVIGDWSFDAPLRPGDRLVFGDMAHYTMVKTTTFNGVPHPAIAVHDSRTGETRVVRRFGYEDYRNRLG